jgi:Tfp pilus assembly protein PilN
MASINLAPGTEYIIAARRRRQRLYSVSVVIILLFALGYGILFFIQKSLTTQNEALKTEIQVLSTKIEASKADATRVALFEKRLVETRGLLDAHIKWDQVFTDAERLLPPAVVLTDIEAGTNASTVTISGTTSDMDAVAQTIASLSAGQNHDSMFSNGIVKSVNRVEQKNGDQTVTSYAFTITLTLDVAKLRAGASQ